MPGSDGGPLGGAASGGDACRRAALGARTSCPERASVEVSSRYPREMTQQATPDERRPANDGRKAAARNRAALVAAAREICAEYGLSAPLSAIACRAGVSQGVLYRHFPDRSAVASAVLEENVREIEQAAAAEGVDTARILGVLTWHLTESAAFISIVHADGTDDRPNTPVHAAPVRAGRARLVETCRG